MASTNTISIIIAAKNEASKVLAGVAGDVKASSESMQTWGAKAATVGSNMTKYVTLPVVGIGLASIKMAGDFQASMTRLVTSAGESQKNLASVSSGVLQVARDTGTSTTQLAQALYMIESGGQHGADGLTVLKAAAQGAKAENSDLATVADAVTSVLVDYHLKASDAADVTSKLVAATSAGKTTFQELSAAMPDILPVASAAHVALSDILGDLAAMTVHGMSAQQSAQNLADVIRHMQNPTAVQAKELALLGLTTTQLADDMKNHGLSGTLQEISGKIMNLMPPGSDKVVLDLKTALSGLSQPVQDLGVHLFDGTMSMKDYTKAAQSLDPVSAKQAQSFATLAGATHRIGDAQMSGSDVMQNYGQALAKATGDSTGLNVALMLSGENAGVANNAIKTVAGASTEAGNNVKGWGEIQDTFNFKLAKFEATAQTSAITLGNQLLPAASQLVTHITNAASAFSRLSPEQQKFITSIAGAVAVLGPGLLIFAKFAAAAKASYGALQTLNGVFGILKFEPFIVAAKAGAAALGESGLAGGGLAAARSLAGAGGLMSFINPMGLALTGLAVAVGIVTYHFLTQKSAAEQLKEAQNRLHDATLNMKDAQNQLKDAELQAEGADLAVQTAQENYNQAVQDFGPNSLQAQQALHDLKQAQQDAKEAHERATKALEDYKNKGDEVARDQSLIKHLQDVQGAADNVAGAAVRAGEKIQLLNGSKVTVDTTKSPTGQQVLDFKSTFGGHALGTSYAPGGMTWVGERGPELIDVPKGSKVYNAKESAQVGAGHQTVNNLSGTFNFSNPEAVDAFWDRIDKTQRLARLGAAA